MTNKEMIKEMVRDYVPTLENCDHSQVLREALTEMAEWKDGQYNEEKKDLLCLVEMLKIDDTNQSIIDDLKSLLR